MRGRERWRSWAWGLACGVAFTSALIRAPARAQVVHDFQSWFNVTFDAAVPGTNGLRGRLELDARFQEIPRQNPERPEDRQARYTLNVRPELGYRFSPWFTVYLGYTYQPELFRTDAREDIHEHRLQEEVWGRSPDAIVQLRYRTRLEQRYRQTGDSPGQRHGEGQFAHRFRQRLGLDLRPSSSHAFRVRVSDEVMFDLNESAYSSPGFSANRALVGGLYALSDTLDLLVAYMNEFASRSSARDRLNHVAMVTLSFERD